jgi:hypothetical protein
MDDTMRLNAIDELGLLVVAHDQLTSLGWSRTWSCHYGPQVVVGATIREVIDLAVLDLGISNLVQH